MYGKHQKYVQTYQSYNHTKSLLYDTSIVFHQTSDKQLFPFIVLLLSIKIYN